ncbi:MAG: metal ABC transporter permease [Candidatus Limiplasma sp.]|nr:metal ABC transporter permease [Candidatus Limiplasma sp.]
MINLLGEMFSYSFMVRALVVGLLVSMCSALLGVSLVLKRYSMIGDGLSHVGFGALAIAAAMGLAPLAVAVPVVVGSAFLLLRVSEKSKIKGDAAIGMISTGALAVGVMVLSLSRGMTTDINNYLFGSILAMSAGDVWMSVALAGAVLVLYLIFYRQLFAVTFDETFARATGLRADLFNMLLALLTAITVVLGMRMMGAMLISSLILFPAITAMRLSKSYHRVILWATVVSVVCFLLGLVGSYLYNTPTGASVVVMNIIAFFLFSFVEKLRERGSKRAGSLSDAVLK